MRAKKVNVIIKNENGETCHIIKDILKMALGRNETLTETKKYIIENYSDYVVSFEIK